MCNTNEHHLVHSTKNVRSIAATLRYLSEVHGQFSSAVVVDSLFAQKSAVFTS